MRRIQHLSGLKEKLDCTNHKVWQAFIDVYTTHLFIYIPHFLAETQSGLEHQSPFLNFLTTTL